MPQMALAGSRRVVAQQQALLDALRPFAHAAATARQADGKRGAGAGAAPTSPGAAAAAAKTIAPLEGGGSVLSDGGGSLMEATVAGAPLAPAGGGAAEEGSFAAGPDDPVFDEAEKPPQ